MPAGDAAGSGPGGQFSRNGATRPGFPGRVAVRHSAFSTLVLRTVGLFSGLWAWTGLEAWVLGPGKASRPSPCTGYGPRGPYPVLVPGNGRTVMLVHGAQRCRGNPAPLVTFQARSARQAPWPVYKGLQANVPSRHISAVFSRKGRKSH